MTHHSPIPDAVAAVIAAAVEDHGHRGPHTAGRAAVRALTAAGWTIQAPEAINRPQTATRARRAA